ncbi:AraC family transcriptional regulator [Rhizobium sp. TRM95111]|uniref:AraC family transcriptional regulator n=1 Tax=Rhizobium alarense TaxID=2846851 RepID=UPI001F1C4517|nr:AraC family transcriptional regulator [Rhizobium alarense]MCF3641278.1 AraC family transcriptional regulator [Rhizobium alarense]
MTSHETTYLTANIPVFLLRCLTSTLADLGFEPGRLTRGLGLSLDDLTDPSCRVSFRQGRELIRRALDMARGHALGLETGIRERITSIGLVGYAMITCPTVGDAIALGLTLQKDTGSMLEFDMRSEAGEVVIVASSRFPDPEIHAFLVEEAFASFMQVARDLVGDSFRPRRVDLAYPAPAYVATYRRIFGCEVSFGQPASAFIYDQAWSSRPLNTADLLSHRQILEFLDHHRARNRQAAEVISSVERILRQNLRGHPQIAAIARELCMSERTLRRRLSDYGVSFQSLLDGQRKTRALELLGNPQLSIEQIAFAVGFTDPHNFRRAFRRWTGSTPGSLRRDMHAIWPE